MSNHFGSFWLESCPLFAVYFAAKPPLPRRGLLRFGTCAGRVAELRKRSSKSSIEEQHALPFCHFIRLNNQQAAFPRDDDAGGRSSHLRPRDFIDCHPSKQFYVVSLSGNRASLTLISSWTKAPAPFLQRYKQFKLKRGNSLLCCHKKRRKQTMPKCFSNKNLRTRS